MGVLKRNLWLTGFGVALAMMAFSASRVSAQPTNVGTDAGTSTDRPGSVVLFPKVIADGTRDTMILLTNTMNMPATAHCVYVNGAGFCSISGGLCSALPVLPEGSFQQSDCPDENDQCVPQWVETNFTVALTGQQPTMWRVSTGRVLDETLPGIGRCVEFIAGDPPIQRQACPGEFTAGNGVIPPNQPFRGELKCVQTLDELPFAGNALKGEAVIETLGSPQISKYNSVNIEGNQDDGSLVLNLDGSEYNVCPQSIEFTHYADIAPGLQNELNPDDCNDFGICSGPTLVNGQPCDPSTPSTCPGGVCVGCPVRTELTLIPCTQNFEAQVPIPTTVSVQVFDELEFPQSANHTVQCWENNILNQINPSTFNYFNRTQFLKTRVSAQSGDQGRCWDAPPSTPPIVGQVCSTDDDCGPGGVCGPDPGVLGVMEEFHYTDASLTPTTGPNLVVAGTAAFNAHMNGLRIGSCRNDLATACTVGGDECGVDGECLFDRITIPPFPTGND